MKHSLQNKTCSNSLRLDKRLVRCRTCSFSLTWGFSPGRYFYLSIFSRMKSDI